MSWVKDEDGLLRFKKLGDETFKEAFLRAMDESSFGDELWEQFLIPNAFNS